MKIEDTKIHMDTGLRRISTKNEYDHSGKSTLDESPKNTRIREGKCAHPGGYYMRASGRLYLFPHGPLATLSQRVGHDMQMLTAMKVNGSLLFDSLLVTKSTQYLHFTPE